MKVAALVESYPGERRVALVPTVVSALAKSGIEVIIQQGSGVEAGFPDSAYEGQKARIVRDRAEAIAQADVVAVVHSWSPERDLGWADIDKLRPGQVVLGLLNPLGAPEVARALADRGVTSFAMELIPRISRAQSMDALSSQANIQGYKAVLMAAEVCPKVFPMMMTAAGTITPAKVFIIGAGVAGLQAIATARRLGAVVTAYDVRPAVKDQVESLGAKFLEVNLDTKAAEGSGGYARAMDEDFLQKQRELMAQAVAESDVVITTAAVPGARAPVLVNEKAVLGMRPQSVIVDLAAETGGNCELTKPGQTVMVNGVIIIGPLNVPATVPYHASLMYARNVTALLQLLVKDGALQINTDDSVVKDSMLTHQGQVTNARVRERLGMPAMAATVAQENKG